MHVHDDRYVGQGLSLDCKMSVHAESCRLDFYNIHLTRLYFLCGSRVRNNHESTIPSGHIYYLKTRLERQARIDRQQFSSHSVYIYRGGLWSYVQLAQYGNGFVFVDLFVWINYSRLVSYCTVKKHDHNNSVLIPGSYIYIVTLQRAGDASFGNEFCPGSTAEYKCQTTEGSLLWETSETPENFIFDNMTQPQRSLGIFLLRVDGVSLMNGMVSAVNSTAVVSNVQPSYNGTVLRCSEYADLSMLREIVLRVAGISHCICIASSPGSFV